MRKLYFEIISARKLTYQRELQLINNEVNKGLEVEDIDRLLKRVTYLLYHKYGAMDLELQRLKKCLREFIQQ